MHTSGDARTVCLFDRWYFLPSTITDDRVHMRYRLRKKRSSGFFSAEINLFPVGKKKKSGGWTSKNTPTIFLQHTCSKTGVEQEIPFQDVVRSRPIRPGEQMRKNCYPRGSASSSITVVRDEDPGRCPAPGCTLDFRPKDHGNDGRMDARLTDCGLEDFFSRLQKAKLLVFAPSLWG